MVPLAAMSGGCRMGFTKSLVTAWLASQAIVAAANAAEPARSHGTPAALSDQRYSHQQAIRDRRAAVNPLDRVASAVDGAESSHGADLAMWRPDPSGPQGPMQVTEAAATDVGGGDRFNSAENRAIGRAYLLQLFWRYKNWPDAIAAYNWGLGKMDEWVKAGRPPDKLVTGVAVYLKRVLHESGLCDGVEAAASTEPKGGARRATQPATPPADPLVSTACSPLDGVGGAYGLTAGPGRFYTKLEAGMRLALQRAAQSR
jgi:transglycosylase-like protein with SLT domain